MATILPHATKHTLPLTAKASVPILLNANTVDPTEQFFSQARDTAQAKRQIVVAALPFIPSTLNLFAKSAKVEEGLVEWDMDKLDELSLWGPPQEDEIDVKEELAKERARRREKGFRPPSPPRFSDNINMPSMLDIVDGKRLSMYSTLLTITWFSV
jgi:hypothetical protein